MLLKTSPLANPPHPYGELELAKVLQEFCHPQALVDPPAYNPFILALPKRKSETIFYCRKKTDQSVIIS